MRKVFVPLILGILSLGLNSRGAISFGPTGTATNDFSATPPIGDFASGVYNGTGTTFQDTATMDSLVQGITAPGIPNAKTLPTSSTLPPSQSSTGFRRHTTLNMLMSRPTTDGTNAANLLLATLQNDSGATQPIVTIEYDFAISNAANTELPGLYAYFSLDGSANSWTPITALSGNTTVGRHSATVNVGSWAAGGTLFILWVDDNAEGVGDPAYLLDNMVFRPGSVGVSIISPTNTQVFAAGLPITINVSAVMANPVTSVEFFVDGGSIGVDTTAPYSMDYSGATIGDHELLVMATDSLSNTLLSAPVQISVVANAPPTISLASSPANPVLVGINVTNIATVSDTAGTFVTNVDFFVNGVLRVSDASSPFTFELADVLAGTHTVMATATDNLGASASASISVVATNPSGVTLLVTNGSTWRYLDDGSNQGTAWKESAFVDVAWSLGQAELGYGDIAQNRPETTVVNRVGTGGTTNITTYFRQTFTVVDPSAFGDLIVRVLRDDGAVVYINGAEVFRSNMTNGVFNYLTPAGPAGAGGAVGDDGTIYQVTNISASVLQAGLNVVAVEIHQDDIGSSDISFDLMLWGTGPRLTITRISDTQVEITWPAPATGYTLEATPSLSTPSWSNVAGVTQSGGLNRVTVTTTGSSRFFRLRRP